MTAKEYLRMVKWINVRINTLNERISCERDRLLNISQTLKQDMVTSSQTCGMDDVIAKIADMQAEWGQLVDRMIDYRAEVIRRIDQLEDDRHRELLHARYIGDKSWEQIAVEMVYSWRYVQSLHAQALIAFDHMHGADIEPLAKESMFCVVKK